MKSITAIVFLALFSNTVLAGWGCNETMAGKRLIERVERIRSNCQKKIETTLKEHPGANIERDIQICQLDADIVIQQSIRFEKGENPTERERAEASSIVDRYPQVIKGALGII